MLSRMVDTIALDVMVRRGSGLNAFSTVIRIVYLNERRASSMQPDMRQTKMSMKWSSFTKSTRTLSASSTLTEAVCSTVMSLGLRPKVVYPCVS
ncbi:TPA: hypothetical protein N0F65_000522 [Lagenidium giganteum]|uniref:Uncharacterized protein n=1 Tax=Lagenidium giganteum TaxID=4803 RepID=A0AAV2YBG6_9STRA|nr:TPA: hypothetical protein N0F65_000522 [Lagenidium giganteum]